MPTFKGYNGVPDIVSCDFSCASETVSKILYDVDPPTYRSDYWKQSNAFTYGGGGVPLDLSIFPELFPNGYHEQTPLKIFDGIYLTSFGENDPPSTNPEPLAHYYTMHWTFARVKYGQYPWSGNYEHDLDEFTETDKEVTITFKTNWKGAVGTALGINILPLLGIAFMPYMYDVYDPEPIGIIFPHGCYAIITDNQLNIEMASTGTLTIFDPTKIDAPTSGHFYLQAPIPTSDNPTTWYHISLYGTSQRWRLMTEPPFGRVEQDGDTSGPGGGQGNYGDETSDIVPSDGVPTISAVSSGFVKMYNPSLQNLLDFRNFLYSTNFIDNVMKLIDNPMDYIIALMLNPATPNTGTSEHIGAGGISSDVSAPIISNQYKEFDCGEVNIEECYGGFLDYDNMTRVSIYLPFCGTMKLDTNIVMHSTIKLRYAIDFLTGDCIAKVYVRNNHGVIAEFYFKEGNCACMIPMTGNNYASFFAGALGAISGVGSAIGGNVAGGLTASAQSIASMHVEHERVGNIQKGHGLLGNYTPYVIIERPAQSFPAGMNSLNGRASNIGGKVKDFDGYTEIESIKLNGIQATDSEIEEIKQLLADGVFV